MQDYLKLPKSGRGQTLRRIITNGKFKFPMVFFHLSFDVLGQSSSIRSEGGTTRHPAISPSGHDAKNTIRLHVTLLTSFFFFFFCETFHEELIGFPFALISSPKEFVSIYGSTQV